jgi:hypothetical protein
MKDDYRLIAMPMLPTEQFPEHLVTFIASNSMKVRRMWTVYRSDLTRIFDPIVSRTEAKRIVSDLRNGLMIDFDHTFTPRQMRSLGFLELD